MVLGSSVFTLGSQAYTFHLKQPLSCGLGHFKLRWTSPRSSSPQQQNWFPRKTFENKRNKKCLTVKNLLLVWSKPASAKATGTTWDVESKHWRTNPVWKIKKESIFVLKFSSTFLKILHDLWNSIDQWVLACAALSSEHFPNPSCGWASPSATRRVQG